MCWMMLLETLFLFFLMTDFETFFSLYLLLSLYDVFDDVTAGGARDQLRQGRGVVDVSQGLCQAFRSGATSRGVSINNSEFARLTQHLPTGLIRPLMTTFFKMYNSQTYNNSRTIFFLSACQSERAFSEFVLRYKVFNIQVYARLI